MKKTLIAICLFFTTAYAQEFDVEWSKQYGGSGADGATHITADTDGNTIMTGYFMNDFQYFDGEDVQLLTSVGDRDVFIQKQDQEGNVLWAKSFGGALNDNSIGVETDHENNIYLTGVFYETVDFDPDEGVVTRTALGIADIFILKLNSDGEFQWVQTIGSTSFDAGYALTVDDEGAVYIGGIFNNTVDFNPSGDASVLTSMGAADAFILKLNNTGEFEWVKSIGGSGDQTIRSLNVSNSGELLLTGKFQNTVDFDPNAGVVEYSAVGSSDVYVLKLSLSGDYVWVATYGGTTYDGGLHITSDEDNNVYVAGYFSDMVDFDPDVDDVFTLEFEGLQSSFIQKLNAEGDFQWVKMFWGTEYTTIAGIDIDPFNQVWITGSFADSMDLDPGVGVSGLASAGEEDTYLVQLTESGELSWSGSISGVGYNTPQGLVTTADGEVYITGFFNGVTDLDLSDNVDEFTSLSGESDSYIAKLSTDYLTIPANSETKELKLYPNPVNDLLTIDFTAFNSESQTVVLFDIMGNKIRTWNVTQPLFTVNCSDLSNGTYYIKSDDSQKAQPIVICH